MSLKDTARKIKKEIPAVFLALKDKDTPILAKILAGITVAYALSPIDLIPDFIPVAGYTDDIAAMWAVIETCQAYTTPEIEAQADDKLDELLG